MEKKIVYATKSARLNADSKPKEKKKKGQTCRTCTILVPVKTEDGLLDIEKVDELNNIIDKEIIE